MMRKREERQQFRAVPVQTSEEAVRLRVRSLPSKLTPRNAVHGETLIVEMKEGGDGVENHIAPGSAILQSHQAICPRIKQRNARRVPLALCGFQIVDATKKFVTTVRERNAQQASGGPEDSAEIARADREG